MMPIPKFDETILPLLIFAEDGEEHRMSDAVEVLAKQFQLTDDERKEMLPRGAQPKFDNRVGWAKTYLKKALLLEGAGHGKFRITDRGMGVLKSKPSKINRQYLRQFSEFMEFQGVVEPISSENVETNNSEISNQDMNPLEGLTPEEALQMSYQSLRQALAQEILQKVKEMSPRFFESLVVDVLVSMGYGGSRKDAGQVIGKSGDGGIDGIIKEDKLGLDLIYI
jgi:restriction system protein